MSRLFSQSCRVHERFISRNIVFLYLFHSLHSVTNSEISPSNFDQIFANHCQREALDVTDIPVKPK